MYSAYQRVGLPASPQLAHSAVTWATDLQVNAAWQNVTAIMICPRGCQTLETLVLWDIYGLKIAVSFKQLPKCASR